MNVRAIAALLALGMFAAPSMSFCDTETEHKEEKKDAEKSAEQPAESEHKDGEAK